jgi:uncharacterized membrane protein
MTARLVALLATALIFGLMDAVWLRTMFPRLYQPQLGAILGELRWAPALIFYALYIIAIQYFAVAPGLKAGQWQVALLNGALFGFFAYATYDLTNHATLKQWSTLVTVADMAWGAFATGATAALATAIALAVTRQS